MKYQPPVGGASNDSYVDGSSSTEGSIPPAASIEQPMREIVNSITAAGLTPSNADLTQLKQAIQLLAGAQMPFRGVKAYSTAGSYTWTVPSDVNKAMVYVTGAGGGGAGGSSSYCSGGGSGGTEIGLLDLSGLTDIPITVGQGGAGGSSGAVGSNGGASSFGTLISANGGSGGKYQTAAATGAAIGSGGDISLKGSDGTNPQSSPSSTATGGTGGASFWGGSNTGASNAAGVAGSGSGGGGNTNATGNTGGDGLVLIIW